MFDIKHLNKQKVINVIKNVDQYPISSFSLKVLLGQLKVKLEVDKSATVEGECFEKVVIYIQKYGNLPNVKKDIKEIFNIEM
jgi:hypothetical protein